MTLSAEGVRQALTALAEHLDQLAAPSIELVVCGGSALDMLGLIDRPTHDIDVLAIASKDESGRMVLLCADPLPAILTEPIKTVARDLGLQGDWLNPGPTGLLSQGLPAGLIERLVTQQFGSRLTVHFVGRFDQICFKLYAIVNGGAVERHLADLRSLQPTIEEMHEAAQWCLRQDAAEFFPGLVRDCLRKIGYANVADAL